MGVCDKMGLPDHALHGHPLVTPGYLRKLSRGTLVWQQKRTNEASALTMTRQQELVLVGLGLTSVFSSRQTFKFLSFYLCCSIRGERKQSLYVNVRYLPFLLLERGTVLFSVRILQVFKKKRECS